MRVGEPRENSGSRRSAEQVQLPVHVQLVRVQLHLLEMQEREGERDEEIRMEGRFGGGESGGCLGAEMLAAAAERTGLIRGDEIVQR